MVLKCGVALYDALYIALRLKEPLATLGQGQRRAAEGLGARPSACPSG